MAFENADRIPALNPNYPLGSDPIGEGDNHIRSIKLSLIQFYNDNYRDLVKRSYNEIGNSLVPGSFEEGGTINNSTEVLLQGVTGRAYAWGGAYPKVVPPNSSPQSTGGISPTTWIDRSTFTLRSEVVDRLGNGDKVIYVDNAPFSGDFVAAYNSIPASGGYVLFCGKRDYNILSLPNNVKPNVVILGNGVPAYDRANKRLASGSGTVLQGSVYNHARGFGLFNLGVDRGDYVRINLAGGVYRDTFVNHTFGADANIRYGDLITLQSEVTGDPASFTHCILNEIGSSVYQTGVVEVIEGYHGHVVKCVNFYGDTTIGRYQEADIAIIKADAGAVCENVYFNKIIIQGTSDRRSSGVLYEAQGGRNMSNLTIDTLVGSNCKFLIRQAVASTDFIVGLKIGMLGGYGLQGDGQGKAVEIGSKIVGFTIGLHQLSHCADGGLIVKAGAVFVDIGSGYSKDGGSDGYTFEADARHGSLIAEDNTGYGVRNTLNRFLDLTQIVNAENVSGGTLTPPVVSNTGQNGWVPQVDFKSRRFGSMVTLNGQVSAGTLGGAGWLYHTVLHLNECLPDTVQYIHVTGVQASGTSVALIGKVNPNGDVQVYGLNGYGVVYIVFSCFYVTTNNQ